MLSAAGLQQACSVSVQLLQYPRCQLHADCAITMHWSAWQKEVHYACRVRWHVVAEGNEVDMHNTHWHGNTLMWEGHNADQCVLLTWVHTCSGCVLAVRKRSNVRQTLPVA